MKKITIPEIAKLANISIGTVDRAINDRPGINPETKKRILDIAKKLHYRPNRLSKALANNKTVNIGMITLPESIPFVKLLIEYAKSEAASLYDFGCRLTIKSLKNFDAEEEVNIIQEFIDNDIDAIAIEGLDHPKIIKTINLAVEKGIAVVTFNTDVPLSK
ncbi:MAG TPA: LacI family DNA-binding transcriptional regulator, partial [Desulfobacterales bacterium]|nr:LacI family DNA-binding transcriptional regulator [Desulfobacterales bacterium]